jgi:isoamylase
MMALQTEPVLERRAAPAAAQATAPHYETAPGKTHPFGATPDANGVNFAVVAFNATAVELLLFEKYDDVEPVQVITLDPTVNKTYFVWHVYVKGLMPGAHYAYRVDGPTDLGRGYRYNRNKVLIDPYARGNTIALWERADAVGPGDNLPTSMRSVVIDVQGYDWEGDRPLNRPMHDTIIYEMHVGGFTRHPSSGVRHPGTFAGVIEKIPYLQALGVTAVELLPVMAFDNKGTLRLNPQGQPLTNYWGYSTLGFFAPEDSYCVAPDVGDHICEFRDMVKALHKAGIEVILDVVFNHTDEGDHRGPTINFRGLANEVYYHLVPGERQYYMNYSGTGNALRCNDPIMMKFIVESLLFWVKELHVDGFRFDLGSVLVRGDDGAPLAQPPVVHAIALLDELADTKVIAEAWDAAGLYHVGDFPGYRWAEWNGRFRDDVRRFVKGDPGLVGAIATRIAGSPDLYQDEGRLPTNGINFVTCHDGFTLNDLVSYNGKHNEANGEGNRDGHDDNLSWNCGEEGETENPDIEALRSRQIKNFTAILLLSHGVPMMLMGDEVRHTQRGNNNAYCQDNDISWFNWHLTEKNHELFRFWKWMIDFRKRHANLRRSRFFTGQANGRGLHDISWHGTRLSSPGWNDPNARALAFTLAGLGEQEDIHAMLNMHWDGLDFEIPVVPGRRWYLAVDTAEPSPRDIAEPGTEELVTGGSIHVQGRSVVVLVSKA